MICTITPEFGQTKKTFIPITDELLQRHAAAAAGHLVLRDTGQKRARRPGDAARVRAPDGAAEVRGGQSGTGLPGHRPRLLGADVRDSAERLRFV